MEKKKTKINEFNILGINMQFIVTILVIIFGLLGMIVSKKMFSFFYLFVGLDLLILASNNKKIYKKEKLTGIYLVFGILMLIYAVFSFLGVI